MEPSFYQWVILPAFIFCARVCDVSLDTLRIMLLTRGKKYIAPILGFVQILIWLVAIRGIFMNLSNPACFLGYAGGYAVGTYVGMFIEEKLAIGFQVIRLITRKDADKLVHFLKNRGFGVTCVDGEGTTGRVNIVYTIVKRNQIPFVMETIQRFNPKAFYTIEDIRGVSEGIFHPRWSVSP